jgi:hypothetical protein
LLTRYRPSFGSKKTTHKFYLLVVVLLVWDVVETKSTRTDRLSMWYLLDIGKIQVLRIVMKCSPRMVGVPIRTRVRSQ